MEEMKTEISVWDLAQIFDLDPVYVSVEESGAESPFFYLRKKSDDLTLISSSVECEEFEEVPENFWEVYGAVEVEVYVFDGINPIPVVSIELISSAIDYINEHKFLNEKGKSKTD